ncbi:MAG: RtcB family protein [Candidatus Hydrogenedentes bacterium]|nr:RtcB family protein [Candidatus Hydrogenedentota bacterium]
MRNTTQFKIERVDDVTWEVPQTGGMLVPGRIFADEWLLAKMRQDRCIEQIVNVAHLPGIVKHSLVMPDAHWGYGFPIGGVAATDPEHGGVISPGGVGYDINCGCRLVGTSLHKQDISDRLEFIVNRLYRDIPAGVGSSGAIERISEQEVRKILARGALWALDRGMGTKTDLECTEENGVLDDADPSSVSERAVERGRNQIGTLGSGNHFLELGVVETVFDTETARVFGLSPGQITLMIHSGSRGLGYQVCDDSLTIMLRAVRKYNISIPDRQLVCAPVDSPEGHRYYGAMAAAANYAWANRQVIMTLAERSLLKSLNIGPRDLGMRLIYDVSHNIAKLEYHDLDGVRKKLCVHRKGATRCFPAGHEKVPERYRSVGQPVLVPGSMGTASIVCAGNENAMSKTFGSACHGAGRTMSRKKAVNAGRGRSIARELREQGIVVQSRGKNTLAEEMPEAYKAVDDVVNVSVRAGICRKVAVIRPIGVVKG